MDDLSATLESRTQKQGISGYGIDAQKKAISDYLNGGAWELLAEYCEVEIGKKADRIELQKALDHCKRTKSTLLIGKLDRLSRNALFLFTLMESGCRVHCSGHALCKQAHCAAYGSHSRERA